MAIKATRDGRIKIPTRGASPPFQGDQRGGAGGEAIGQG